MDLKEKVKYEILHPENWRDPYDTEKFNNRYVRGVIKRFLNYYPNILYKFKILKSHSWDENYILLGIAALNLQMEEEVDKVLNILTKKKQWGLPIVWHSRKYKFPIDSLMSTTTSECILFLCEVARHYPNKLEKSYLKQVGHNLLNTLNKVYINKTEYIYSYTKYDNYNVINSNLLVAAALRELYKITNESLFFKESKYIEKVIIKQIPKKGFIPYFVSGNEQSADSYHQLFCMRSLYILENNNYENTCEYFEDNFINQHGVLFKVNHNVYDLQGLSESLRYYGITKNTEMFHSMKSLLSNYKKNDNYIQKFKIKNNKLRKYNSLYSRQGYHRLLCALSYEK
ncbi:hypothetical protein [Abyssicoccus albus]|uniref:Uncharacterized protein n=1 Tax=Abyssicoccus albus TaxID=1817405 RepID=A0A3N5BK92_9BACL|nr:hypothetical protein [Abyssicoccus albus]RPF58294.1 hypothetical protein EDD62_0938 [Abyssicoccus albus]